MNRVVITGLGVIAPNAHGLENFADALHQGKSGITFRPKLKELNFGCQVAGVPADYVNLSQQYFTEEQLISMNSNIIFASIAAIDAWKDAGFSLPTEDSDPDWNTGAVIGTGIGGLDTIGYHLIPLTNAGKIRRLGSTAVERVMASGVSARVAGLLALGNQVTTNSSACSTGTEAIINAANRIKFGLSNRMLAGGSEGDSHYIWAGFDGMRVLNKNHNQNPEQASRPMSQTAAGFIPGSGAGILMLESLDSALTRGARIYAEIIGSAINCGGHRNGGSMTAPNPVGVQRCIRSALRDAGINGSQIDAINGHLTATFADPYEINNWQQALDVPIAQLPYINSTKSLVGHTLGAAGGIEAIACILQLYKNFIHGSANCEDLHENLQPFANSIAHTSFTPEKLDIQAKASFGFGDVNSCLIFKKWTN